VPTAEILPLKEIITQAAVKQSLSDLNDDVIKDTSE